MKILNVSTEHQIEIIEALAREIWTEHYIPIIGKEQVEYMLGRFQSPEAITEQIRSGAGYFLMAEDRVFIGYLAVETRGDELFLSKIYVKKSFRGKGHGKRAMHYIETLARERRLTKIVLTVNKNNAAALGAYEKLGFRNAGSLIQDIGGGFVMDDYKMEKALPAGRRESMMRTVKAGLLYFALVFGTGFILGPMRVLWLVPRVGTRMAELTEAPVMLVVIVLAARGAVRFFAVPSGTAGRLGMGFIALGLLLVAEFSLARLLTGLTIAEYLASRDPVSGTVFYVLLGIFALLPVMVTKRP
jgi:GNAT superfamily N-acetyltransferase